MLALIKYFHTTKDEYKPLIYQNFISYFFVHDKKRQLIEIMA